MIYLIRFQYEHYCQGYEWVTETILVHNVHSFARACEQIQGTFAGAKDFVNLTYVSLDFSDALRVQE